MLQSTSKEWITECQKLYIFQIEDLYEDFHITKLPLLEHEVRGTTQVQKFSEYLLKSFNPDKDKFTLNSSS